MDPKARGMNLGYDQAVALPAMQADGKSGQEDIFRETNKARTWWWLGGGRDLVNEMTLVHKGVGTVALRL